MKLHRDFESSTFSSSRGWMMTRNWLTLLRPVGGAGTKKLWRRAGKDEVAGESSVAGLHLLVDEMNTRFSLVCHPC